MCFVCLRVFFYDFLCLMCFVLFVLCACIHVLLFFDVLLRLSVLLVCFSFCSVDFALSLFLFVVCVFVVVCLLFCCLL